MEKDFDKWNEHKKIIHRTGESKLYHRREVWWCSLGLNVGFEQDGTGEIGERPVLVIKGFSKNVCLIVPLTTSKKKNPYHIAVGRIHDRDAFAIISQIRLIDSKRLINKVCYINDDLFNKIRKAIKELL